MLSAAPLEGRRCATGQRPGSAGCRPQVSATTTTCFPPPAVGDPVPSPSERRLRLRHLDLNYAAMGRRSSFGAAADSTFRFYRAGSAVHGPELRGIGRSVGGAHSTDCVRRGQSTRSVRHTISSGCFRTSWRFRWAVAPPSLDYSLTATSGTRSIASGGRPIASTASSSRQRGVRVWLLAIGIEGQGDFELRDDPMEWALPVRFLAIRRQYDWVWASKTPSTPTSAAMNEGPSTWVSTTLVRCRFRVERL